jgi:uncharacterized protein YndB with AHSA1/START domain
MTALEIRKAIEIDAPVQTVWRVLTDNEFIQQYMFGCTAESDWKPGSPLLWKGVADGTLYVKGHVVLFEPPHQLVYTVIYPNASLADIPSNYLTMTCNLKTRGARAATLEIIQGDFATVEDGSKRYEDSIGGGDAIMPAIKKLAEELYRESK